MSQETVTSSPTDVLYGAAPSGDTLHLFDAAPASRDLPLRSFGALPHALLARANPSVVTFALSACAFLWAAASHGTRLSSSALVLSVCVASAVATVVVLIVEARAHSLYAAESSDSSSGSSSDGDSPRETKKTFKAPPTSTAPSSLEASALLRSDVAVTPDLTPVTWVRVDSPINRVFPFIAPHSSLADSNAVLSRGGVASRPPTPEKAPAPPADDEASSEAASSPAESTASSTAPSPKAPSVAATVLLIEDNSVNVKVALRMLKLLGLKADVAENGLEGVRYVERYLEARRAAGAEADPALFPPLFILCDLMMPVLDGHQAAERIRHLCAREPGVESPHIVAVTADVSESTRKLCLVTHFDDYLAKPLFLAHLRTAWSKFADRIPVPPLQLTANM